jgi:wobble nucleotide-excising tRNase
MLRKIDILEYGSFKNYKWKDMIGENTNDEFGSRNIIYGRNYAGKTTFSRIVRSFELGKPHKDFNNGKFTVTLDDGREVSDLDLDKKPINVRVFNMDFKKEHLSFLYDEKGNILPFAIFGGENIEIQNKIKLEENKLEEIRVKLYDPETGLNKKYIDKKENVEKLEKDLTKTLSSKASQIRNDPSLFLAGERKQYNIKDIEKEILVALPLNEKEKMELENTVKENIKEIIPELKYLDINYIDILKKANSLLSISIKPSKIIESLANNNDLQEWVRDGINLHKGITDQCAFCGNIIDDSRWEELDRHFTREVEDFTEKLEMLISELNTRKNDILDYQLPFNRLNFYSIYDEHYNLVSKDFEVLKNNSISKLDEIYEALKQRRNNLFVTSNLLQEDENFEMKVKELILKINKLIDMNNKYTNEYMKKQNEARRKLRYHEISVFKNMIDYDEKKKTIETQTKLLRKLEEEKTLLENEEQQCSFRKRELEASLKDEKNAVRLVNKYLKTFLGHPELYLDVENGESEKSITFVVKRNNQKATNLSEGEQTLIAFCYFLATLKDISNREEYIILIDDPISSLDTNHIFYIYSLLASEIVSKEYKQVFISTHNLDLLKYLQKLTPPSKHNRYYLIEKRMTTTGEVSSIITRMPKYLQKYSTEFIYLFHQIYRVSTEEQSDENYQVFYSFPNTARKFIETYMFFKYPNSNIKNDKRILEFFGGKLEFVSFLNRINNEFSHGENQPDRLLKPIDIPEFKKVATIILDSIKSNDVEQYSAFLESIDAQQHDLVNQKDNSVLAKSLETVN